MEFVLYISFQAMKHPWV